MYQQSVIIFLLATLLVVSLKMLEAWLVLSNSVSLLYDMNSGWQSVRLRIETNTTEMQAAQERTISTHILDTTLGKTAANVPVILYRMESDNNWLELSRDNTNADGRIAQLIAADLYKAGIYKLRFEISGYYEKQGLSTFYPFIEIVFECKNNEHYHVPLLLNPYGYSTYRGS